MPLKKSTSDKAFRSNVRAEVKSGKPVKREAASKSTSKGKSKK